MAETKCPVDKDFGLNRSIFRDKTNLFQAEFPRKHHTCQTHLGCCFRTCQIVDTHLGAGMQREIRQSIPQHSNQPDILYNNAVGSVFRCHTGATNRTLNLSVINECIERGIYFAATYSAVSCCFFEFLSCEIFGSSPCIVITEPEIHCVRTVLNGCNHSLGRSCR